MEILAGSLVCSSLLSAGLSDRFTSINALHHLYPSRQDPAQAIEV